jgi:hypothetical protein
MDLHTVLLVVTALASLGNLVFLVRLRQDISALDLQKIESHVAALTVGMQGTVAKLQSGLAALDPGVFATHAKAAQALTERLDSTAAKGAALQTLQALADDAIRYAEQQSKRFAEKHGITVWTWRDKVDCANSHAQAQAKSLGLGYSNDVIARAIESRVSVVKEAGNGA